MRSLGAAHVVDHTKADFTDASAHFDVADGLRYVEQGHARGKVVVTVA